MEHLHPHPISHFCSYSVLQYSNIPTVEIIPSLPPITMKNSSSLRMWFIRTSFAGALNPKLMNSQDLIHNGVTTSRPHNSFGDTISHPHHHFDMSLMYNEEWTFPICVLSECNLLDLHWTESPASFNHSEIISAKMNRIGAIFQINCFLRRDLMTTKYLAVSIVFSPKIFFFYSQNWWISAGKSTCYTEKTCFPSFIL